MISLFFQGLSVLITTFLERFFPRDAQRDAYLTEAALQTRPVLSLSFLIRSEIPREDCYLFDKAGSWSGKPKKATSDGS
jgi:hypothetical protein